MQITQKFFTNKSAKISLIVFSAILVLYLLLDQVAMPLYTRQHQAVQVPEVTFLTSSAATKLLQEQGLRPVKGGEKYDENYPPGFVLFQNPEGGSRVKKGRRVYLVVGKGQRIFPMPRLAGIPLRDVKFILKELKLNLGNVDYAMDAYYPQDVVSEQSIPPENPVSVSETVDLVVSLGEEPTEFIVPDLIGKSQDKASLDLLRAGLTLGEITRQETEKLIPNTVISQSTAPGMIVAKGDTVNIVISELPFNN